MILNWTLKTDHRNISIIYCDVTTADYARLRSAHAFFQLHMEMIEIIPVFSERDLHFAHKPKIEWWLLPYQFACHNLQTLRNAIEAYVYDEVDEAGPEQSEVGPS